MITINPGTTYAKTFTPSSLTWSLNEVSQADSGRDTTGTMHTGKIARKRKLEMEFNGLTWAEAKNLINAFFPDNLGNYYVTYPDIKSGTMETRQFYNGDAEAPFYVWWDGKKILSSVKFNIIEV